jgi:NSS family neurotransmitter:Na+ symporter
MRKPELKIYQLRIRSFLMTSTEQAGSLVATTSGRKVNRERFATGIGVLMATLGSAVGLGNIWKFPTLTGSNGGAAFLIVYLVCTLLVGLPIMITEQALGRKGRSDAVNSLKRIAPGKAWWLIGAMGILAAFLIMAFYTDVAGWVLAYIFKSASGALLSTNPETNSAAFNALASNPLQSLVWQWIALGLTGGIIMLGVTKGIEATTKRLMPILFGLLVLVCIRSLTLPGAGQGLAFLFNPDFSKITAGAVLTALGLAFFKLSIGMGCMITYGGYYGDEQNIPGTATRVVLADLAVSILAGIAVFPAVFAFGFKPDAGASLLFITIPAVFASMPLGSIFMVIFFVLTFIASVGAQLSLLEVIAAYLKSQFNFSRVKAALFTILPLAVIGSPAALSSSTLAGVKVFGMTFFDLYDYVSSNLLLPVGGLFLAVFAGWFWGYPQVKAALTNEGKLANEGVVKILYGILRFITPILVVIVLLKGLKVF